MYMVSREGALCRLTDEQSQVSALIAPRRGALLTGLTCCGRDVIYYSEENFRSAERPRCGMPVLFPACGRSPEDRVKLNGNICPMPIHGFAHTSSWEVIDLRADAAGACLILQLQDSPDTRQMYPFSFCLTLTFLLRDGVLSVSHCCTNRDTVPMPFDLGYHPYFRISALENAAVVLPEGGTVTLPMGPETGSFLPKHCSPLTLTDRALDTGVTLCSDESFGVTVLWSIPEKQFLCMEPWRGVPNGLSTGTAKTILPGEQDTGVITIRPWVKEESPLPR